MSELATRLLLLVYNLWDRLLRFMSLDCIRLVRA